MVGGQEPRSVAACATLLRTRTAAENGSTKCTRSAEIQLYFTKMAAQTHKYAGPR